MRLPGFVLAIGLLVLFSAKALAQEDEIEEAIGQSLSSAAIRELQAQARTEVPKTGDRHELAIFYHKRGMANYRLGNYGGAMDDLRLALENNQPNRPTPQEWGNRWRTQFDLGNTYRVRSDWFSEIDHWQVVVQEYRQSNPYIYHFAQLRLIASYSVLGQWAEAERARQEADRTLSRLRNLSGWATREFNSMSTHNRYVGIFFHRQGNYLDTERRYRASFEWSEKNLELRERVLPAGDQAVRAAVQGLAFTKRLLADILATQGKYGEAEVFARATLQDSLALYGSNTIPVGASLSVVGWTRFQQGDIAGAEKYYQYALEAVERFGRDAIL